MSELTKLAALRLVQMSKNTSSNTWVHSREAHVHLRVRPRMGISAISDLSKVEGGQPSDKEGPGILVHARVLAPPSGFFSNTLSLSSLGTLWSTQSI